MRAIITVALCLAVVGAAPRSSNRIVGGSITSIDHYPSIVVVLDNRQFGVFRQDCGGTIINNRSVLSAAHCHVQAQPHNQAIRAGSSYAHSEGVVYNVAAFFIFPGYTPHSFDLDVSVIRIVGSFTFSHVIQPAPIAGPNYDLKDNEVVWAAGWGAISEQGPKSEELRHVQVYTINQEVCKSRYLNILTDNMLCSGILDEGGRDQCGGDSGGPLYHHGVVVGITSFGMGCARAFYPGVNARVTVFSNWIVAHQ